MQELKTERLLLRHLEPSDDVFILELLNDPDWLRNIGDKGVRDLEGARRYIAEGPVAMYRKYNLGLYLVALGDGGEPIGLCGLLKRDNLDDVDIGFAFLPAYRARGFALEAARAVMEQARTSLGIQRVVALVSPGNSASEKLLGKLGLRFEAMIELEGGSGPVQLFVPAVGETP